MNFESIPEHREAHLHAYIIQSNYGGAEQYVPVRLNKWKWFHSIYILRYIKINLFQR